MRNLPKYLLLTSAAVAAAGCATRDTAEAPAAAAQAQPVRYSARDFFETTSFQVAAPTPYAFSPNGRHLLITSDQSGVFNTYRLPVAGGAPAPLTASTDNATFAVSYFPNDERVLVTSDRGGNELNHL